MSKIAELEKWRQLKAPHKFKKKKNARSEEDSSLKLRHIVEARSLRFEWRMAFQTTTCTR